MAVSAKWYGRAFLGAFNKEVDWDTDTIKVALLTNAYTPDQDNHDFWDDVSANETSGTGYTAGGETLASKTLTYDGASNTVKFDGGDVVWSSSTITARYAVVYVDTGTPSSSRLLGYVDFGQDESSDNGNFTITWDAAGIFTVNPA